LFSNTEAEERENKVIQSSTRSHALPALNFKFPPGFAKKNLKRDVAIKTNVW